MSRDVKIALYNGNTPKSKVLTSVAGISVLDNYCTFCKVKEDLSNGNYELDATFIIDHKNLYKEIKEEAILKVKLDYGYEVFRIAKVTLGKKYIDVFARQITIQDQLNTFLSDVRPTQQQGISALRYMIENSDEYKEGKQYARDLEFSSNIETLGTAYYQNMNLYEALFDCDQSFINRWGGEIQRRGYRTIIDRKIGQDRGFQVREGKNLTGFEALTNIDSVVTRIKPVGYDGITIDGYVQSALIDKYSTVKTRKIKYDNVKVKKDADDEEGFNTLEEAQAELIRLAKLEFTEKHIDEIEATFRINFIDLFKTEEYKDYAILERVYLGDSVNVYIESLDIDITVRAIAREYNVLSQEVVEIELSNLDLSKLKPITISDVIKDMDKLPDSIQGIYEKAIEHASDMIMSGLGGHAYKTRDEFLILDTEDIVTATEVLRINRNGIGYSRTGYNGKYETAITADGKLVISEATCEVINAVLIKTGKITSANGTIKISIDDDYLEVGHGEAGTKTRIDAEGFYILDENNETIASLASKESWTELKADKVFANNIENIYLGDSNLYVNHSNSNIGNGTINNPFNSFSALKEYLEASPIINKDLNIYIISTGNVSDNLDLRGLKGRGALNFTIDKNLILNGNGANSGIYFYDCQNYISINGGRTGYNTTDGALINKFKYGVFFNKCKYGVVEYIAIDTSGSGSEQMGVLFRNTNGRTHRVDFCDSACAIYVDQGSNVRDNDSCGNGSIAFYSLNASNIIFGSPDDNGYRPNGSLRKVTGNIVDLGNRAVKNSFRVAPPIPPTSNQYKDFSFSDYGYYSEGYGNWNSIGYKTIYQGSWGYGNNRGIFTLPNSSINSFLANATVLDGSTITLQRENAGGYSSAQTVYLCGTTHTSAGGSAPPVTKSYGSIGSLAWGERKTFTLPKAFVNDLKSGVIKSVLFYTSDGSNYIKFSAVCTLRLKVNK